MGKDLSLSLGLLLVTGLAFATAILGLISGKVDLLLFALAFVCFAIALLMTIITCRYYLGNWTFYTRR